MVLVRPSDFVSDTIYHHDVASCPSQSDTVLVLSLPPGRMSSTEVRGPERGGTETPPWSRRPSSQCLGGPGPKMITFLEWEESNMGWARPAAQTFLNSIT